MTLTVLCVDDSSDDTLLLQHACRRAGVRFQLQTLDDGDKAIDYFSGKQNFADRSKFPIPHLVLLDLKMPCRTGFEVLEWMRGNPAAQDVPVAVFSSSHHEADIREAYRKGAKGFLTKPVEYEALVQLVKTIDELIEAKEQLPGALGRLDAFKAQPGAAGAT